jgi:hypothetical protein
VLLGFVAKRVSCLVARGWSIGEKRFVFGGRIMSFKDGINTLKDSKDVDNKQEVEGCMEVESMNRRLGVKFDAS